MLEKLVQRIVPAFATEAEEAKWWDANREMVEDNLRKNDACCQLAVAGGGRTALFDLDQ